MLSILLSLTAYAQVTDDAFEAFDSTNNPSAGTRGDWTYGYEDGGVFTALPTLAYNSSLRLSSWQSSGGTKVTHNDGPSNKTYVSVFYPNSDFLVLKPKVGKPAVVRFTSAATAALDVSVTFRSMRTINSTSAMVSVEQDGVVIGGCSGSVSGLYGDASGNMLTCNLSVPFVAGDSIDFVVDAGASDANDDIGLMVEIAPGADTDLDGLSDVQEDALGTDPNDADTDDDDLEDGDEVNAYGTDPLDVDTDGDSLWDGDEVNIYGTDPTLADSDGGGTSDGDEVLIWSTDPTDPSDDPYEDSLEAAFAPGMNPSQGVLGAWSFGYDDAGSFVALPGFVADTARQIEYWRITGTPYLPQITNNYGAVDRTYSSVSYPAEDWLVLKPRKTNAAMVRFTADAAGTYRFDATFRSMRTLLGASADVSVEQDGVVIGGCSGSVLGLKGDASGNEVRCSNIPVVLDAGDSVDFVVDAAGSHVDDDIGLRVWVWEL